MTTNETMQVGRQCLQNFTGLANPEALCAMAEVLFSASDLLSAAEDEGFGGGSVLGFTSIDSYLPFVCCSIREAGWLSRGEAYKTGGVSTADDALNRGVFEKREEKRMKPEEKDYNLASATIQFVQDYFEGCDVATISDYENSLRVAMASGIVHPKFVGIIASAVKFYQKDLEKRARAESWSKLTAGSQFQGTVGERQVFENLKVMSYRTWESNYGVTHFYSFLGEKGLITYFATRDMDLSVGQVVSLKASVKKHEVYQPKSGGAPVNQTVITRAALVTRAKVVSYEVEAKEETHVVSGPHYEKDGQSFNYYVDGAVHIDAKEETKTVKYHRYHLVSEDGRKYVLISKSKKKALVAEYEAVVEYAVEGLSGCNGDSRPVGLVK